MSVSEKANLPWSWFGADAEDKDIFDADGVLVAATCGQKDDAEESANAEFIVSAVNSHDELLSALEALVAETERCDKPGLYGVGSGEQVMVNARAAIQRARGEQ
jgi:hypothetical protein